MKGGRAPCTEEGIVISVHLAPLAGRADRLGDGEMEGVRGCGQGRRPRCKEVTALPEARGQRMQGTTYIQEPVLGSWVVSPDRQHF